MKAIIKKQSIPETLRTNAKCVRIKGISIKEKHWEFSNDDPQIIIRFSQPVTGIYYQCKLGKASFEAGRSVLYYRGKKEAFSETMSCRMPILPNRTIERRLFFQNPITEIRFDPSDFAGECEVLYMELSALDRGYRIEQALAEKTGYVKDGILVLSQSLSETGAPILACHIAEELKGQGLNVAFISMVGGNGFLEKRLNDCKIPYFFLNGDEEAEAGLICVGNNNLVMSPEKYSGILFARLKKLGFTSAIANTIVTAPYVKVLKYFDYKVVSLIHEMKTSMELYGYCEEGKKIADCADVVVFPNEAVKEDFIDLYGQTSGKCIVRPQGVYLREDKDSGKGIEQEIKRIYHDNALLAGEPIIMSSGTADLRKGVDLFVTSAIMLKKRYNFSGQFIWTGDFTDINVKAWLEDQICRAGCEGCIHFIPFIKDQKVYKQLLMNVSMFWAMSREDPFPSTVLEAMKNRVPVVGFAGTGGIEVMLSGGRGVLVDNFDVNDIVEASGKILKEKDEKMLMAAEKYADGLKFDEYVAFLKHI